jgi:SP family arabinose:H+ symporter-like MFS transporter
VNWAGAFLVTRTFLSLMEGLGPSATFGLFALTSAVALFWARRRVPETKGRSLEEIEAIWSQPDPVAASLGQT